ncbi:hypothetical protein KVR01_009603 [Diaporthe batatas]|uniref:uncharacterized protein n=1 Tax=Diaporthe batatas TaxID=748121 RepID=UPI001D051E54|nr:uncharacterized protein KVR01_009603 [Diaporthe batatas]KAG8161339.1 hypothetical protein KVR01_009603 [Diaporthe batatas]
MANTKRRREEDHDPPESKKSQTNKVFTVEKFMADFPPLKGPLAKEDEPPLPSTVLADDEMQDVSNGRKPPFRSTFNMHLPLQLRGYESEDALNTPFNWMKKQYFHCIIPELGEEYDFAYESDTFYTLRDFHNARVRIREGQYLPDYIIYSLATRWLVLGEKGRPASDGYLAQDEIFVATCLPLSDDKDAIRDYFEGYYLRELSAQYYIPKSKYSVHFVGEPKKSESEDIQHINVGSVLIRNTKTGRVIYIDTGARTSREGRARRAGLVLKAWLQFQKQKTPDADLGPISRSVPLILDVKRETHPSLRSLHAIVSATLFLKRRITDWGEVKAFTLRGKPCSKTMAKWAVRSISGWLGLNSPKTVLPSKPSSTSQTFGLNYQRGALMGRKKPHKASKRIVSAKKGNPPVYNDEPDTDNDAVSVHEDDSDHEASDNEGSLADMSHGSVSGDEDTDVVDQSSDEDDDSDNIQNDEFEPESDMDSVEDKPAKKASPKKVNSGPSSELDQSDETEDDGAYSMEAYDDMIRNKGPSGREHKRAKAKREKSEKEEPKKKRLASEDVLSKKSKNTRQAKGAVYDRNPRSSI